MKKKSHLEQFHSKPLICVNSLPSDKIVHRTKLKAFADNKLNIAKMTISLYDRVENNVVKGENAGLPVFSPFPTMFSKVVFFRVAKSWDCVVKSLPFTKQLRILTTQEMQSFENIVGKGENAGNQHFYAPASKDWGHFVLPLYVRPSICPSICLSICLSAQT